MPNSLPYSPILEPAAVDAALNAIMAGVGIEYAASLAGVSPRTMKRWLQRGRNAIEAAEENDSPVPEADVPYADFAAKVEQARSAAVLQSVSMIKNAGNNRVVRDRTGRIVEDRDGNPLMEPGDWRAHAWYLERMHHETFGQVSRTELTGAGGAPIELHQRTQLDAEVSFQVAAHPDRTALIAAAMRDAGMLSAPTDVESSED